MMQSASLLNTSGDSISQFPRAARWRSRAWMTEMSAAALVIIVSCSSVMLSLSSGRWLNSSRRTDASSASLFRLTAGAAGGRGRAGMTRGRGAKMLRGSAGRICPKTGRGCCACLPDCASHCAPNTFIPRSKSFIEPVCCRLDCTWSCGGEENGRSKGLAGCCCPCTTSSPILRASSSIQRVSCAPDGVGACCSAETGCGDGLAG